MNHHRKIKLAIYQILLLSILLFFGLSIISILAANVSPANHTSEESNSYPQISNEVLQYRPLVEKYAEEYQVEAYVDVLLAMMMQESGGRGKDPMQASESYCGEVGCIDDPEFSIKQGVYYFKKVLLEAEGDIELAIQSYNFGRGFIPYVLEEAGTYTEEIAIDFSKEMYENASDKSIYTCLREEAKQYNACYGDIYYVKSVMQYKEGINLENNRIN